MKFIQVILGELARKGSKNQRAYTLIHHGHNGLRDDHLPALKPGTAERDAHILFDPHVGTSLTDVQGHAASVDPAEPIEVLLEFDFLPSQTPHAFRTHVGRFVVLASRHGQLVVNNKVLSKNLKRFVRIRMHPANAGKSTVEWGTGDKVGDPTSHSEEVTPWQRASDVPTTSIEVHTRNGERSNLWLFGFMIAQNVPATFSGWGGIPGLGTAYVWIRPVHKDDPGE